MEIHVSRVDMGSFFGAPTGVSSPLICLPPFLPIRPRPGNQQLCREFKLVLTIFLAKGSSEGKSVTK